jgi:hypothetical protein
LETLGGEGDYDLLDRAWAECGRWAEKLAQFEHPKIQAVRLAADPNAPVLPENMTLDHANRSSLTWSGCAMRACSICRAYRKGIVANPKADLPMNGRSSDQAE